MPVPVIAAVNGVAAGAGANFALGCDMVVAARGASFIQAFSKIGLIPDCGGTWLLPRLVGRARALGLAMTGDKLPAEEAAHGPDLAGASTTRADGQRAGAGHEAGGDAGQGAGRDAPRLDEALDLDYAAALAWRPACSALGRGHDFAEGVSAFFAKRPPSSPTAEHDRRRFPDRPAGGRSRPRRDVEGRPRLARRWAWTVLAIGPGTATLR
jgi:2-(1,2-epoxy-1,2-dihydrophenyl)acetyl-CoA isomerase